MCRLAAIPHAERHQHHGRPAGATRNQMGGTTMKSRPDIPPNPIIPPPPPIPPRVVLTSGTSSVTIDGGQSATIEYTVDRLETTAAVSLNVGPLPQGVTAALAPSSLPAS